VHGDVLVDFLFGFAHPLEDLLVPAGHAHAFVEQLGAEDEEEHAGRELRPALRDERREYVAHCGGEDGHDHERRERAGENDDARVLHRHNGRDEKGHITNLGNDGMESA